MLVDVYVTINASRAAIWSAMTDFEHAADIVSGILKVEILERPAHGLVGLKWRETRMYFGKPATADKWITEAVDQEFYKTRAESDGFVFVSTTSIADGRDGLTVTSVHDSLPQTLATRLMIIPMGLLFKGVARKALRQDLLDLKAAVEKR
jgi:hypothetical protein